MEPFLLWLGSSPHGLDINKKYSDSPGLTEPRCLPKRFLSAKPVGSFGKENFNFRKMLLSLYLFFFRSVS